MIKLKQLQQKQQQQKKLEQQQQTEGGVQAEGAVGTKPSGEVGNLFSLRHDSKGKRPERHNAARLRVFKDISEMDTMAGAELVFPDQDDLMHFNVKITPSEGLYRSATFLFNVEVPNNYPYDPPKVHCSTLVYHPNIDFEGHVCLNILRNEWMPVLSLGSVVYGLMTLFLEPNPDDPLNKEAATLMIEKPAQFERNVRTSLEGGYLLGKHFPRLK